MFARKAMLPVLFAVTVGVGLQAPAAAQRTGSTSQRRANAQASADLRTRMETTEARITMATEGGKITRPRAATWRRQIARDRASMARLSARQGFVSAAEIASYERTLAAIDLELDRRGAQRSYGNDMLPAGNRVTGNLGDDALPSAEVSAFQKMDARLQYRGARIEHDARGCAVYQGTAKNGRVQRQPLLAPDGRPICMRRR